MDPVTGTVQAVLDPGSLAVQAVERLLSLALVEGNNALSQTFGWLVFGTGDLASLTPQSALNFHGLPPLTQSPTIRPFVALSARISEAFMALMLTWAMVRSMWERTFRAHYTLKALLPKLFGTVILVEFSQVFCQFAIDINNALVATIFEAPVSSPPKGLPGHDVLAQVIASHAVEPFLLVLCLLLLVAMAVLVLSYVVRYALLCVLVITAPLAAVASLLPESRYLSRIWTRTFTTALLMQPLQVLMLKFSTVLTIGSGLPTVDALYGLAVLYLMLKVPGVLHSSNQLAGRGARLAHHMETVAVKAITPAAPRTVHRAPTRTAHT
ncbi:MAG: conjugal transfer protein TrbL family protein [Candidatus Dormibacteria bacterium]